MGENIAVKCTTQEQWDYACDFYDKGDGVKEDFKEYDYNVFGYIGYCGNFSGWNKESGFARNSGVKFITFNQWKAQVRHQTDIDEGVIEIKPKKPIIRY